MYPKFDERDQKILDERLAAFAEREGPQTGHYVRFADGTMRRISHVWDWEGCDDPSVQTSDCGSWYFGEWYMSFSGSLYKGIPASTLARTNETKPGRAWFFHHDYRSAHNGVDVMVDLPVWECSLPARNV